MITPDQKQKYIDYLSSEKWKQFRKQIIDDRGQECEKCGDRIGPFHLHHHHYNNLFNEKSEDVLIVCIPCHEDIHNKRIAKRARKKAKTKWKKLQLQKIKRMQKVARRQALKKLYGDNIKFGPKGGLIILKNIK